MIIDWHHHVSPREFYEREPSPPVNISYKLLGARGRDLHEVERHIEFMDAAGIDMAVLSSVMNHSLEDRKLINDNFARIVREYPRRFVALSSCLPTGGDPELKELDRAIRLLGLRGAMITPYVEGTALDSDKLYPFYEMVSNLKAVIYVHPGAAPVGPDLLNAPYNLKASFAKDFGKATVKFEIAIASIRVVLGGVLAKFPDLRFVFAHMGAVVSPIKRSVVDTINTLGDQFWMERGEVPPLKKPYNESFDYFFGKIYSDVVATRGKDLDTFDRALTSISPERLLFGSHFPFTNLTLAKAKEHFEYIKKLNLQPRTLELILGGNAANLLNLT